MISIEYKEVVKYFYDFAFRNATLLVQGWACYTCKRCVNKEMLDRDIIIIHLYRSEFISNYKHWYLYKETWEIIARVRSQ